MRRPKLFDPNGDQHPRFKSASIVFTEPIQRLSPNFVEIHRQAQIAESEELTEIAGPGYRKALEFLVKDYLISRLPNEADEIKTSWISSCIKNKIVDPRIQALAAEANLLATDEAHYERRYGNSEIGTLKKLISATVAWIELEVFTDSVASSSQ